MSTANEQFVLAPGLLVKTVEKGTGPQPSLGDLVHITYTTLLDNGTVIENNKRLVFVIGRDQTIEALDRGVAVMRLGEAANITATPKFAYGAYGLKPLCGANDRITLKVTLNENLGHFDPKAYLPLVSRLTLADSMRERGNFLFVRNEDNRALMAYKTALGYMFEHEQKYLTTPMEDSQMGMFMVKTYNNLAATHLRIGNFIAADSCVTSVLHLDPTNVKGLYRKGMALKGLGDFELALSFLECALQADPNNEKIKAEIQKIDEKEAKKVEEVEEVFPKTDNSINGTKIVVEEEEVKNAEFPEDINDKEAEEKLESIPSKEEKGGKRSFPGWVKWAAGAAAIVGTGLLIYKLWK